MITEDKTTKAAKKNKKKKKTQTVHHNEIVLTQALHGLCAGYYKVGTCAAVMFLAWTSTHFTTCKNLCVSQ
jgi:hypothetical protein